MAHPTQPPTPDEAESAPAGASSATPIPTLSGPVLLLLGLLMLATGAMARWRRRAAK
jgi:hypothetical protein